MLFRASFVLSVANFHHNWRAKADADVPIVDFRLCAAERAARARYRGHQTGERMNVYELTRALVDIESISENEAAVADHLLAHLRTIAATTGGQVEPMAAEPGRANVLAWWGVPLVTLSTHMDTVPPFFPSREDDGFIWGRGACDAKGIIAAMIAAAEKLLLEGTRNFALLFVVGEERNSAGAMAAARQPRGSRYLVNGEPTENKLALASKGTLRLELSARGRMAHSAYPELGDSAIEKLLDALEAIRRVPLPKDDLLGASTLNIGTISGGRAPNVIPDAAKAELLVRLVGDPAPVREAFARAAGTLAELKEVLYIPAIRFANVDSLPTTVVSYTTDVPVFGRSWGEPLLLGPGSIHVAHTSEECISKRELADAVELYADVVKRLLARVD
ncbi:MAG: M20/M25/M40 family metallo-hydrolase [Candidatus Acidiferrales bacterium]